MIKEDIIKKIETLAIAFLHTKEVDVESIRYAGQTLLDALATINACMFSVDQLSVQLTLADMTHSPVPVEQPQGEPVPEHLLSDEERLGPLWKDLGISVRLKNVLKGIECEYNRRYYRMLPELKKLDYEEYRVGHFNGISKQRMLCVRNFGRKSMEEMEEFMNRYGFALANK